MAKVKIQDLLPAVSVPRHDDYSNNEEVFHVYLRWIKSSTQGNRSPAATATWRSPA